MTWLFVALTFLTVINLSALLPWQRLWCRIGAHEPEVLIDPWEIKYRGNRCQFCRQDLK